MNRFVEFNINPNHERRGDCVIRAISTAEGKDWHDVYLAVCIQGYTMADMPSSDEVWHTYLMEHGYKRYAIPDYCPACYTLEEFCEENPEGTFIVALPQHVVCVKDGHYYDTWDSGVEKVNYVFRKE